MPVQRIMPDSDGTRQKNAGRLISSAQGLAFAPIWARRLTTASTQGLGVLSLWVVSYAKHELAGHQGVGAESPPRAAVRLGFGG